MGFVIVAGGYAGGCVSCGAFKFFNPAVAFGTDVPSAGLVQLCPEQDILQLLRGEIAARGCAAYRAVLVGNREGDHGEVLRSPRSCPRRQERTRSRRGLAQLTELSSSDV